jgi:hypothetical protein
MEFTRAGKVLRQRHCVRVNKVCEHFAISRVMAVNAVAFLVTLGDSKVPQKGILVCTAAVNYAISVFDVSPERILPLSTHFGSCNAKCVVVIFKQREFRDSVGKYRILFAAYITSFEGRETTLSVRYLIFSRP